ncbi:MAG TPA: ATP-binding protein [Rhizomicrobium sp.]|nr:ATP-binding protein [Rhizomicrobium sp.]
MATVRQQSVAAAALAGAGFFVLGYGALRLSPQGSSIAIIWPADAFALCLILRYAQGWRERAAMLAVIFTVDLFVNRLAGANAVLTLGYSLVDTLELALCLVLVGPMRALRFKDGRALLLFSLKVVILPPFLGGLAAMLVTLAGHGGNAVAGGRNWFFADVLGFCIVFPIGMAISWRQIQKLKLPQRLPLALFTVFLLVTMTVLVFPLHRYPLQFLILPAALVMTSQFRVLGAGAAMIIIAAIVLTEPVPKLAIDPVTRIQYLQLFLAVCGIVCVRAATLLNQRDLHQAIIERRHRRAVRASRFKSQLLAHVSHEVRSPLSAIIGFSSMLESGSMPAGRAPEFAAVIGHNGELLQRLHDDLLDLSRAEAGVLSIEPRRVAVGSTLRTCVGAIRMDATLGGKDVLIEEVEDALAVTADPVRLAQILNNLIANAFKYGDNFSPIRVRARALEDGFGRIEIVNAGPGIPVSERQAVFLPFRRSAEVGRRVPGAGLGLSIAKLLVEAQGGRIDFESVPGRQTRFWIDLPLAA